MTEFRYLNAPCGAGKSHWAAQQILEIAAPHLVVRDRLEAIDEFRDDLYRRRPNLRVEVITSGTVHGTRARVRDLPDQLRDHCVVLITHTAMMISDLSKFEGWHVWIDETPSVYMQEAFVSSVSHDFLERNFKLSPLSSDHAWHAMSMTETGWRTGLKEIAADSALSVYRNLYERVLACSQPPESLPKRIRKDIHHDARRAVVCDLPDWSAAKDRRAWSYWSVWSPKSLNAFRTATVMANGFDRSLTFELFRKLEPDVDWQRLEIPHRPFANRTVTIEYFAETHRASRYLFESDDGKANLQRIASHLKGEEQIWMTNERYAVSLREMGGLRLSPKQAGSNQYENRSAAACIYSAKPSPVQQEILTHIGLDPEVWTETNEHETILQFLARTSIRDPKATANVTLTVYDKVQAAYLQRYFENLPHCDVEMRLTDLGFAYVERGRGRPAKQKSDTDRSQSIEKRKEADRARAKRNRANLTQEQRDERNRKRRERYARRKAA